MIKSLMRSQIPAWLRTTCEQAASDAARALGIPVPALHWKTSDERVGGWVNYDADDVINLNVDALKLIDPAEVRAVVFHEARHCWQWQTYRSSDRYKDEVDAESWSYQKTGVLLPGPYYTR